MSYEIDTFRNLVTMTGYGTLTNQDLIDCVRRMLDDDRTRLSMPSLVDIRDVEHLEVTKSGLEDMLEVVRHNGSPESKARIAVVTDGADTLIARLLEALADAENTARQYRSFATGAEAMVWLGLD
jgi:hypothetical protein